MAFRGGVGSDPTGSGPHGLRMDRQAIAGLPLCPEGRKCRRPTARRLIDLFDDVQRHSLRAGRRPPCVARPIKTSRVDGSGCAVTDSMTATHPVGPEVLPERVWAGQLADDADHDMADAPELAAQQQQPPLGSSIEPAG